MQVVFRPATREGGRYPKVSEQAWLWELSRVESTAQVALGVYRPTVKHVRWHESKVPNKAPYAVERWHTLKSRLMHKIGKYKPLAHRTHRHTTAACFAAPGFLYCAVAIQALAIRVQLV